VAPFDIAQSLENLKLERDAITLYDALASIEKDAHRSGAFRMIAANERRHAEIWATKLRELGADVPPVGTARMRVRTIIWLARIFGTRAVSDLVQALEGDEEGIYAEQVSPEVAAIAADEREHAEIWKRLEADRRSGAAATTASPPPADPTAAPPALTPVATPAPSTRVTGGIGARVGGATGPDAATLQLAHADRAPDSIGRDEQWHQAGQSGTLRAVIFGVSDGLVSNTSLVMGVAGAASGDPKFILLAAIAGLLAGSFSMAAGEYISMQSQRELYERQIALERAELEAMPEEEEAELAAVFRAKGFTDEEARTVAKRLFQDPQHALDTLIREELGLDPNELGSPWRAAVGSFVAFAVGAAVPVIPFLFGGGTTTIIVSIGLSLAAMFGVGAAVSLLTGRSALFSGARQVVIGIAAATVTFLVGRVIGVSVS
jgi:VIT1/CCC1 family predicted Fe2+/Mn2+ transporter